MKKPIFYTQRKNIFCSEDGKGFFKMTSEGIFESLSDEDSEAFENLVPNGVYEISTTFVGTVDKVQNFLNENEDHVIKMEFRIEDSFDCFLHESFSIVLNDLKCKGIKTVDLSMVGTPYLGDFQTNFI